MNTNNYPFNNEPLPRRLIVAESGTVSEVRDTLERLAGIAKRKLTRRELTPPVQSDDERGQGESTNAKLHRLLNG